MFLDSIQSAVASGLDAFKALVNGARWHIGTGTSDYLDSDGTTITSHAPFAATNLSGTNTGDLTLAAVGSAPSANGATLSGQALTLQPADATHPGVVNALGAWHTVGSGGGEPAFQNSWANLSGTFAGYQDLRFKVDAFKFVHIEGSLLTPGSANTRIFTLPAGYRPLGIQGFLVHHGTGTPGNLEIDASGNVTVVAGVTNNQGVYLSIAFSVE